MSAESQPDEELSSASSSQQASSGPSPEWIQGDEYRILLESFAQAIWETDAAGKVVVDSPSWRAFTGQTLAQWLDKGWVGAVHPDEQALALTQWQEAVSQRLSVNVEFRLHRHDAGWSWTNVRATPIFNPDQS